MESEIIDTLNPPPPSFSQIDSSCPLETSQIESSAISTPSPSITEKNNYPSFNSKPTVRRYR